MRLRCAILDDYQQVALSMADWSHVGDRVDTVSFSTYMGDRELLVEAIKDKDIVVIMRERTPFPRDLFERLPHLKLLITSGARNASIDLAAASDHGVTVCGTDVLKEATMEHAWGLLLSLARHIPEESMALKHHGVWQTTVGTGLRGKQLGLLGLGSIGSLMVPVAKAFGMKAMAWSQHLTQERADALGVTLAPSKKALLQSSDFVSIHLVLSDRTRHLLKADDIKQMKKSAYLINTSRAPIIERAGLIEALQQRWIAGAAVDVYEVEPLPQDDIMRSITNLIITPHLGYVTSDNYQIFFGQAVDNIDAYLRGEPKRLLKL
jgi:phosphoglycerate dehydrogenase-like enzyme